MNQHLTPKLTFIIPSTRDSFSYLNSLSADKYSKIVFPSQILTQKLIKKHHSDYLIDVLNSYLKIENADIYCNSLNGGKGTSLY